jgi:hypothetical protein
MILIASKIIGERPFLDQLLNELRVLSISLIPAVAIAAVLYVLWAVTLPLLLLRYGRAARFARWRAKPRVTVLASTIAFAYFIWPTPWTYMTLGDESFRLNRINFHSRSPTGKVAQRRSVRQPVPRLSRKHPLSRMR